MGFQPEVNARIHINGKAYTVGAHPQAPGVPYGQEGRQGTVYLLYSEDKKDKKAIKVFRSKFVNPSMVHHTQQLARFKGMAGLWACDRMTVTPQNNTELLSVEPDLLYSVVMPWVEGPTWMDVLLAKKCLTRKQSFSAAFALAHVLTDMEQRGLAHCDLSAPNLILPMLNDKIKDVRPVDYVQMIDLEQMYSPQLERPEYIPAGSQGYVSQTSTQSLMWGAHSDRFSGAVLMMEMLGSCSDMFMDHAWGESYFAPAEMQSGCERYNELLYILRSHWGEAVASLFARAWGNEELTQCPPFAEWLMELSKIESKVMHGLRGDSPVIERHEVSKVTPPQENGSANNTLLQRAKALEAKGKIKDAIEIYRSIQVQNPHSSLGREVDIAIADLERIKGSKAKNRKREARSSDGNSKGKTALKVSALILMLGLSGFLAYKAYGDGRNHPTASELQSANERIESLTQALTVSNKKNEQLALQLKQQKKPLAQQAKELSQLLDEDYNKIRMIVNSDSDDLDQMTFEASEKYMQRLFDFIQVSLSLDEQWANQTTIVQGYYFPYIYNRDRNAQLNLQFYSNYKKNFE